MMHMPITYWQWLLAYRTTLWYSPACGDRRMCKYHRGHMQMKPKGCSFMPWEKWPKKRNIWPRFTFWTNFETVQETAADIITLSTAYEFQMDKRELCNATYMHRRIYMYLSRLHTVIIHPSNSTIWIGSVWIRLWYCTVVFCLGLQVHTITTTDRGKHWGGQWHFLWAYALSFGSMNFPEVN